MEKPVANTPNRTTKILTYVITFIPVLLGNVIAVQMQFAWETFKFPMTFWRHIDSISKEM